MYLAKIIINVSILIWLLPPFKQYKGGYFLYFLILGYSDPLALTFLKLFKIQTIYTHLIIYLLLTISILFYTKNLKIKWLIPLITLCILSILAGNRNFRYFSLIVFNILIFLQILIPSTKEFYLKQRINIYYSILLLYELMIILQYTAFAFNYTSGVYFFYLSLAFEMLIGLFFIFYNLENSPLIKLSFGKKYEYWHHFQRNL